MAMALSTAEQAQQILLAQIAATPLFFARDKKGNPFFDRNSRDFIFDPVASAGAAGDYYSTILEKINRANTGPQG